MRRINTKLSLALLSIFIIASETGVARVITPQTESQTCSGFVSELNHKFKPRTHSEQDGEDKLKRGYCLIKLGQFQEGISSLSGVEKELPSVGEYVIYYQAVGYEKLGNHSKSEALLNKILTRYPRSALRKKVLDSLASIYIQLGNYAEAEKLLRALYYEIGSARIAGQYGLGSKASYLYKLGEVMEKQQRYGDALDFYKKTWIEHPETRFSNQAYQSAQNVSNLHRIHFQPTQADYLKRANTLFERSRWGLAIKDYQKLSLRPNTLSESERSNVQTKWGISMVQIKRLNDADRLLAGVKSPEALFWRGKIKAKQGFNNRASEIYSHIQLLYPSSPLAAEGLYKAARLYQINGNRQKAVVAYNRLVKTYPRSKYAKYGTWNLGWIYYRQGMYGRADAQFSAILDSSLTFNSSRAKYWKARTLEKQGRKDEAGVIYRELTASAKPSYYSFLSQRKTGSLPRYAEVATRLTTISPSTKLRKEKVKTLMRLGMRDDARLEIKQMEYEANLKEEFMVVSLLYSEVGDYYNSIKIAQRAGLPQANVLSFPLAYRDIVSTYTKKYGVDELLIYSIIREESRFQEDAVSSAKAVGLMQLIPPTARIVAKDIGIKGFIPKMLTIPRVNIEMGTWYFRKLLDELQGDVELALAGYNAGPRKTAEWKARLHGLEKDEFIEEITFSETRNYIKRILRSYGVYKAIYRDVVSPAATVETTKAGK